MVLAKTEPDIARLYDMQLVQAAQQEHPDVAEMVQLGKKLCVPGPAWQALAPHPPRVAWPRRPVIARSLGADDDGSRARSELSLLLGVGAALLGGRVWSSPGRSCWHCGATPTASSTTTSCSAG